MSYIGLILGSIIVIAGIIAFKSFKRLAIARNLVDTRWSAVIADFDKRLELVPGLMDLLRQSNESAYAQFHDALPTVQGGASGSEVADVRAYQTNLSRILRKLLSVLASYPEIEKREEFQAAGKRLVELENRIEAARRLYNDAVKDYNATRARWPMSIFADGFDYRPEDYLEIEYTTHQK
jgi:LemA protein